MIQNTLNWLHVPKDGIYYAFDPSTKTIICIAESIDGGLCMEDGIECEVCHTAFTEEELPVFLKEMSELFGKEITIKNII